MTVADEMALSDSETDGDGETLGEGVSDLLVTTDGLLAGVNESLLDGRTEAESDI